MEISYHISNSFNGLFASLFSLVTYLFIYLFSAAPRNADTFNFSSLGPVYISDQSSEQVLKLCHTYISDP